MSTTPPATGLHIRPEIPLRDGSIPARRGESPAAPENRKRTRKRTAVAAVFAVAALALIAVLTRFAPTGGGFGDHAFIYFTVQKRDLPITVTERGSLESQKNVEIVCEVDDIRGDGIVGTPILWVIPNGSEVKKGALLVELDSSMHIERLDEQTLKTDRIRAWQLQTKIAHENRISKNATALANAELDETLAELGQRQYEDENGGTYQLALQKIELSIAESEAQKVIDERNKVATEHLAELGYKSQGDVDKARLMALKSQNALLREQSRRRKQIVYDYVKRTKQLEGTLASAKRAVIQVGLDNKASERQAEVTLESANLQLEREEERLARYREQLTKCKIYAPQDGMVAYAVKASRWGGSTSTIAEGMAMRERQQIMTLPDLKVMQVKMSVHESVVNRVKAGLKATVRLDAFPELVYQGTVQSVAVLPDPGNWLGSGTKVYKTTVTIDQQVDKLKPGMTAVVEIHINHLRDVLCVPVQALVQRSDETWCYVADGSGSVRKQLVDLGLTNDKFVEVLSGLKEGDTVILNPSAVLDESLQSERDISPDKEQTREVSLD